MRPVSLVRAYRPAAPHAGDVEARHDGVRLAQRGIVRRVPGTGTVDDIAVEIQRIIGR